MIQIHDPSLFSVLVPTYEGTRFLRRMLDYFREEGYEGRIVLSDNSSGEHRAYVSDCARSYPDLAIETHLYPHDIRFLDKMVASLERIDSRFVMVHAHDDFMVPQGVERCVDFLAGHDDYGVARGRVAMVALSRGDRPGAVQASLVPHPMRGYEQDDALERVVNHIERYASALYSVHRREHLVESFRITEAATKNVIFFQYLSSCISALLGKIWCADELFYVRQGHDDSWSASLKKGHYEHWPMLITSPAFSAYYQEFRNALAALLERASGMPAEDVAGRIDRAATSLFLRAYCGKEFDNAAEAQFLKRLADPASEDSKLLRSVVDFAAAYPDTI